MLIINKEQKGTQIVLEKTHTLLTTVGISWWEAVLA